MDDDIEIFGVDLSLLLPLVALAGAQAALQSPPLSRRLSFDITHNIHNVLPI